MKSLLNISEAASMALHTCTYLASTGERLVPRREIAAIYHVSEAHLAKVLRRLVQAGLLRSVRGPQGGNALARPPEDVTLLEVLEAIEGPLTLHDCLFRKPVCGQGPCIMGNALSAVNETLRKYLSETRLSNLVPEEVTR